MFWIISDTHFGHKNLQKYTGRPENVDDIFLENIRNAPYKDGDTLIHLGDFCIAPGKVCQDFHSKFTSSVPYLVHTVLVRGNHDVKSLSWYTRVGWDMVVDSFMVNAFGYKILFSHVPVSESACDFDINIHGHLHNASADNWEPEIRQTITDKHVLFDPEGNYVPMRVDTALTRQDMRTILRLKKLTEKK